MPRPAWLWDRAPVAERVSRVLGQVNQIVGGNIETFTRACEEARRQAYHRMSVQAMKLGADAVICTGYEAMEFTPKVIKGAGLRRRSQAR